MLLNGASLGANGGVVLGRANVPGRSDGGFPLVLVWRGQVESDGGVGVAQ